MPKRPGFIKFKGVIMNIEKEETKDLLKVSESNINSYEKGQIIKPDYKYVIDNINSIYRYFDGCCHRMIWVANGKGIMINNNPGNYVKFTRASEKEDQIRKLQEQVKQLNQKIDKLQKGKE